MRGKNRIGWGLAVLGLSLTAWLGMAALPGLQFAGWWWIPIALAVIGIGLIVCGASVLAIDMRRARDLRGRDADVRRAEIAASIAAIEAEVAKNQYWRGVASDYRDAKRVQAIDATLGSLAADLARAKFELAKL